MEKKLNLRQISSYKFCGWETGIAPPELIIAFTAETDISNIGLLWLIGIGFHWPPFLWRKEAFETKG